MSEPSESLFWQAKIWGLLHDPALKALHNNAGRGSNSFWQELAVMQDWKNNDWNPEEEQQPELVKHIHLADYITSASDRGAIGSLPAAINYDADGLEVSHLLSGDKLPLVLQPEIHQKLLQSGRTGFLNNLEQTLLPETIQAERNARKVFWWLWRCLPTAVCQAFGKDDRLLLMPAQTRLPDSSLWNHASLTAAFAGALAGNVTAVEIQSGTRKKSHPYLATFTFTPVQELIKASRKMRDFWAGSWILHYLSARVSWKLAQIYGPDSLIYPSLFQQPLIDYWLLQQWTDFSDWITLPSDRALLTAGFPNVLVLVLPEDRVRAAMQTADQILKEEWKKLGHLVFNCLQDRRWMPGLEEQNSTWNGWLDAVWQTYWTALPIGKKGELFKKAVVREGVKEQQEREKDFAHWVKAQNQAYGLIEHKQSIEGNTSQTKTPVPLFQHAEKEFLKAALEKRQRGFSINVGSWWAYIFDQTRLALSSVKIARKWTIPTAYSTRSTVSGIGSAVHPDQEKKWMPEGEIRKLWQHHAGLFDGSEQLNATETVKRGLYKIIPDLLNPDGKLKKKVTVNYPDLTAGAAGYLKVSNRAHLSHFNRACRAIQAKLEELQLKDIVEDIKDEKWRIPWIDEQQNFTSCQHHSRFLNSSLLVEISEKLEQDSRVEIQQVLDRYYPNNNPADWYVIAAGDGDNMSKWLKGDFLENYADYIPKELKVYSEDSSEGELREKFQKFLEQKKRMGPSTHSALSRALLDFSNQLVPYLTEQRYAGRLIYGGGDDVLAYINLWEWDRWIWDIRQCFRGERDPQNEFDEQGDYWRWKKEEQGNPPKNLSARPLFTMGRAATISFGVTIAHHSVPLAIALENLWEAEAEAKEHYCPATKPCQKDAVQVRVLYGNGNILKATAKFEAFNDWRSLLDLLAHSQVDLDAALCEQAAQLWQQHPAPDKKAISVWTQAFCSRRDIFQDQPTLQEEFRQRLVNFLTSLWTQTHSAKDERQTAELRDREVQNWLKLAAFVLRNRDVKLGAE